MKRSQANRGEPRATTTRHRRRCVTDFNDWSDRLPCCASAVKANRKRYPNAKSRFAEPGRTARAVRGATAGPAAIDYRKWMERERARLAEFDGAAAARARRLGPVRAAYADMVEADGTLDGAAAALGYLMSVDDERSAGGPSIQSQWPRTRNAIAALVDGNGSSAALCRAAFAFMGGGGGGGRRWPWAAELFLVAALARQPVDGGPDGATCLFAAGWFYATAAAGPLDLLRSVRLLDEARRVAAEHRPRWRLPDAVRDATGVRAADAQDPWRAVCLVEHRALLDAARSLDAPRALRAARAACCLADRCGLDDRRRAPALYQLAVCRQAVGDVDGAVQAFRECAAAAAAPGDPGPDAVPDVAPHLDLDARLRAALLAPGPPNDGELQRLVHDALARRNVQLTVKTIVARGRAVADSDRPNAANAHFLLAHRLIAANADLVDADDADDAEQARASLTWLGSDDQALPEAERSHDAAARTRAGKMLRRLRSPSYVSADGNRDRSGVGTSSASTSSRREDQISLQRSLKVLVRFFDGVDVKQ